jgi:rubrerythrin
MNRGRSMLERTKQILKLDLEGYDKEYIMGKLKINYNTLKDTLRLHRLNWLKDTIGDERLVEFIDKCNSEESTKSIAQEFKLSIPYITRYREFLARQHLKNRTIDKNLQPINTKSEIVKYRCYRCNNFSAVSLNMLICPYCGRKNA